MARRIDENKKRERLGETIVVKDDIIAEIIEYNKSSDITVKVSSKQYGYTRIVKNVMYGNFKRNKFLTQYKPIYGKGFVDCKTKDKNGHTLKSFKIWWNLLKYTDDMPKLWYEYSKFKEIFDNGEFHKQFI